MFPRTGKTVDLFPRTVTNPKTMLDLFPRTENQYKKYPTSI